MKEKPSQDKKDELILLYIPIGLCGFAAMWYLFGFGLGLLFLLLFFPLALLKLYSKK